MSYRVDKQVLTAHTDGRTHRQTDAGNDNTWGPKLASGKNESMNAKRGWFIKWFIMRIFNETEPP